jgi:hypothetical protein
VLRDYSFIFRGARDHQTIKMISESTPIAPQIPAAIR